MPCSVSEQNSRCSRIRSVLRLDHFLEVVVFFAINGQTAAGDRLPNGGPGELRAMRISRRIVIPAVSGRMSAAIVRSVGTDACRRSAL